MSVARESLDSSPSQELESSREDEKVDTSSSTSGHFFHAEEASEGSEEQQGARKEGGGDEEDMEDIELLAELRDLCKSVTSSLYVNISSESLNSSVNEDPEYLKRKVVQLQQNVSDWKQSYDLLMKELRKLSLEKVIEKEELVKEVKVLSSGAKDLQQTVRRLESELVEHQKMLSRTEGMNEQLLKEVNSLRKERGMSVIELNSVANQVDDLNRTSQLGRVAGQDLHHVLQLIEAAIKEGTLKLSQLKISSEEVTFPCEDLPVGLCTCGPILEQYKLELAQVRQEVEGRVSELEQVRGEMAALQDQHQDTVEELGRGRGDLEELAKERTALQEELQREREHKSSLEAELQDLESQLEISRHKELCLDDSLASANDSLIHVQELTQQRFDLKEQELAQVKQEMSDLEKRHSELEQNVGACRQEVSRLERAERAAVQESEELKQELESWRSKERKIEELSGEKDRLQRKLHGAMAELDCQVKLAEQYKSNLDTVQLIHCKCQEEAGRLRAVLLAKETDLAHVMTALQLAAGQVSALRGRDGRRSPKSPLAVSAELSECQTAVEELERDLSAHSKHWEEVQEAAARDSDTISRLSACKQQLEEELEQRRENIEHLEQLMQKSGSTHAAMVGGYEGHIESLSEELEVTRSSYQEACGEVERLKEQLASLGSLQEQRDLLVAELEKRDGSIARLQTSEGELEQRYHECLERAKMAESARFQLEKEYGAIREQLAAQERQLQQLEGSVEGEKGRWEEEVDGLREELEEGERCRSEEAARYAQIISELKGDLKAKTEHLEVALEDEHAQYLQLQHLLGEKEKAIQQLQEEREFLDKQYGYTKKEVDNNQRLVECLQEDLAASKGRCDGLQQAVLEYEKKLQSMAEELQTSKQDQQELEDRVAHTTREVEALQGELRVTSSHHTLLQEEGEGLVQGLRAELERCEQELVGAREECQQMMLRSGQEREERERLAEVIGQLEALKEELEGKVLSYEKNIRSLKSQVSLFEKSHQLHDRERVTLTETITSLTNQLGVVKGQLGVASDRLAQQERSRAVLESVGSERLEEIRNLTREVEELRPRVEGVAELRDQVGELEEELGRKQEEINVAHIKLLEAEQSHREIHEQVSKLEQCLTDASEGERREEELRQMLAEREEEASHLREECCVYEEKALLLQTDLQACGEKEHHWQSELSHLAAELELSRQQVLRLEADLSRSEAEIGSLEGKLRSAQRKEDLARVEVSSAVQLEDNLKQQLSEKRVLVLDLEKRLGTQRGEIATLKGKLTTSEDGRGYLQQRVTELEGECDQLLHSQAELEEEVKSLQQALEERGEQNRLLQEDCRSMTVKMSSLSTEGRSTNDSLVQRIREMDTQLAALKAAHHDLELRNEMLMQANSELKNQMSAVVPVEEPSLNSSSIASLNGGPSSLSLNVNVDISNLPTTASTTTVTTGTNTLGVASASVPIRFDSQYRRTMESCLQPPLAPALDEGGHSETESEAATEKLDKEYWIRRAGELSVQLQQSSEYWAQKVRELSIDLEKQRQVPRQLD